MLICGINPSFLVNLVTIHSHPLGSPGVTNGIRVSSRLQTMLDLVEASWPPSIGDSVKKCKIVDANKFFASLKPYLDRIGPT